MRAKANRSTTKDKITRDNETEKKGKTFNPKFQEESR